MRQYSFLYEGNGVLSKFGGTKKQRRALAKYIKSKKFIKMAFPTQKQGNDCLRNIGMDFIKHGYSDPPINQKELAKAIKILGL